MASVKPGNGRRRRWRLAVVGGIADRTAHHIETGAKVRYYASSKEGGAGELRRLKASLRRGGTDEVWILTCWIGHSECHAIVEECNKRGIPVHRFAGLGRARRR
jgi:siroheme synthase (precorrin-2 oxidase/ferrochelatase)